MSTASPARPVVRLALPRAEERFPALGTEVRLVGHGAGAARALRAARRTVLDYHVRLSRFLPGSELSALNADPRTVVPASPLLRDAVRAGLWAAHRSGGLVDPGLLDEMHAAGYARSFTTMAPAPPPLPAGPGRPARPRPQAAWRAIRVDEQAGTVARPAGLRLDLGGTGKGHVADLLAPLLDTLPRWAIDCGGDVRVGGRQRVDVAHPLHAAPAVRLVLDDGAVATSSVVARAWTAEDGGRRHHLLDPATGRPAWTGLLSVTALAPTTLAAEVLAKTALLGGSGRARAVLAAAGGVLVHAGGGVERVGPLPVAAA